MPSRMSQRGTPAGRRASSRGGDAAAKKPVCSVAPTFTGTAIEGTEMACLPGTWSNTPDLYLYQWFRSGNPIAGANEALRVLTANDVDDTMTCAVIAVNLRVYGASAITAASDVVVAA